ncbi:hypothetical protein [Amycolatopsis sp. NPDC051372]|uniref:hypothetical protein n=1 Tax=unclassified Amycolatopsis TaxID=2618356 RepID=UPI00341AD331
MYYDTAFGPASVRIHELAVAAELRDPLGIEQAAAWHPPATLPAGRRSHYCIELASAQLSLGGHEDAYLPLQGARRVAPEHTRAPGSPDPFGAAAHPWLVKFRTARLAAWVRAR